VLVAVTLIVQTIAYVQAAHTVTGWSLVVLCLASAACLLLGLLTPIAAVAIGLAWLTLTFSTSLENFEMVVLAVVIALLGPGAFSIDARMFGRREILIPLTPKAFANFSPMVRAQREPWVCESNVF
jgi:uncharacterized membrane protein YphA (DoxX/SURF4 family)